MIYWPAKAPGEVEDFAFDFTGALETGETIVSRIVAVTGATKNSDAIVGSTVVVWVSGGTLGTPGVAICSVVTSNGRTYSETAILPIGEEPVNLTMARAQCHAEGTTADDDLVLDLIQSAREHVEQYCSIRLMPVAGAMTFDSFAALERLTLAPVQSIVSVKYLDASGVEQTLDPATYEFINVDSDPLRPAIRLAFGKSWPATRSAADAVRVSAAAGYTVAPKPVIRAMLTLIGQWYDYRSGIQVDARGTPAELPNAVTALLTNYRR